MATAQIVKNLPNVGYEKRFLRYSPERIRESIERNKKRREQLANKMRRVDERIIARESRLKELAVTQ